MILVTGANGPFGRQVVERLLRTQARVAVSVRDRAAFAVPGVEVRQGDFDRPESLDFGGAETVLINATNYGATPADRGRQQAAAIEAAAGARRVVITSWVDVEHCPLTFVRDFPATERLLKEVAASWTILRMNYGMATSLARDVHAATLAGILTAPAGDAHAAPAATADLAEATAKVLLEDGHAGQVYELTGPEAIDWHDLAALAGVAYRPVGDEEFAAQLSWPPHLVAMLLDYYAAFRSGWAGTPSPDLATILGRAPSGSLDAVRDGLKFFDR
jgi:NAD(P)H dehydrogenase (quinone)